MVVPPDLRSGDEVGVPSVLAVEILWPSSRWTDLLAKTVVLAWFGCPHYWLVDPLIRAVRVFRLVDGFYLPQDSVEGNLELRVVEPFPVAFRPVDLTR